MNRNNVNTGTVNANDMNSSKGGADLLMTEDGLLLCDSTGAYLYDSDNNQLLVNE